MFVIQDETQTVINLPIKLAKEQDPSANSNTQAQPKVTTNRVSSGVGSSSSSSLSSIETISNNTKGDYRKRDMAKQSSNSIHLSFWC